MNLTYCEFQAMFYSSEENATIQVPTFRKNKVKLFE